MSRTATPADPLAELSFELDGFEWAGEERLEVSGRWFGVRGRRFVRPTLTLRAGGRRRRLVAVLEHKPWAAVEESAWTAAFAWRGDREVISVARLEVAPDVVLELPPPGEASAGTLLRPRPRRRPAAPSPAAVAPPADSPPDAAGEAPAEATGEAPPEPVEEPPPVPDPVALAAAREEGERAGHEHAQAEIAAVREDAERRVAAAERRIAELSEHEASAVERAREVVRLEGELAAAQAIPERSRRELVEARRRAERAEQTAAGLRQRVTDANDLTARLERRLVDVAERNERLQQRIAELEAAAAQRPAAAPPVGDHVGAGSGRPAARAGDDVGAGSGRPAARAGDDVGAGSGRPAARAGDDVGAASGRPAAPVADDFIAGPARPASPAAPAGGSRAAPASPDGEALSPRSGLTASLDPVAATETPRRAAPRRHVIGQDGGSSSAATRAVAIGVAAVLLVALVVLIFAVL